MQRFSVESQQAAIRQVPTIPRPVLSQADAVRLSGLSRRQVENLIADGRLATLQCGSRLMISRCSLEALLRHLHGRGAA
jgi:hypothetical protein